MQKVVGLAPGRWETWFYLARMQALEGKAAESADSLRKAFALNTNDRVNLQGTTLTLHEFVQKDGSFDPIRGTPEYQKAMATNH
jgi:cytochrome c-type biogenesis protein CcmH/NrfG